MLDLLGIIIGLGLLMFLAYKGMSIIWIAPITAGIVALFGGINLLEAYTVNYMQGFVNFTRAWFPVFLFGAIFGKVMGDTGAAQAVAHWIIAKIGKKQAILAVVLGCGVLTYGGVSLFVVVFAMYPLALALFREANLSRALIPGAIALGSFTFTMTAIPGSPQIQNLIPMQYYGTTPTAAPIMGIAGAVIMLVVGMLWMQYSAKKRTEAGEVYTELAGVTDLDVANLPNPLVSAIPLLSVILLLNLFNLPILYSLGAGILLALGFNFNQFIGPNKKSLIKTLNDGASGSVLAIINTSAAVGFGAVVQAVPGFEVLKDLVLGIGGNPLISQAVAVNILAGATGSASGGMGIALQALGEQYMGMAQATGIAPAAFHRVASIASGGLDTLPHNGAVLTLLAVTSMTHKTSYKDIFMVGSAIPILALIVAIIFAAIGLV